MNKILAIIFLVLFVACQENSGISDNPAVYNDSLVSLFQPVQKEYNQLMESIYEPADPEIGSRLVTYAQQAEQTAERVNRYPAYGEDDQLASSARSLAEFYLRTSRESFPGLVKLVSGNEGRLEDVNVVDGQLLKILEEEKEKYNHFLQAQESFAARHNIQLVYPDSLAR